MPANTKQSVETSPTGKTIITAMNHLPEYNFLEALNLAHRNVTTIKGHSLQNFCWHKCADPDGCFGYDEAWSRFGKFSTPFSADIVLERSTLGL
jgi:hypothetical protein